MRLLILAMTFISINLAAQELNINLDRQEVTLPAINPEFRNIDNEELKKELKKYQDLLEQVDNIQLRDGTVIDVRNLNLSNDTRSLDFSGTGGGG